MSRAGTDGTFPNGDPKINGIVVGFMRAVGMAVNAEPLGSGAD